MQASQRMNQYFESLKLEVQKTYDIASQARKKECDPQDFVEVQIAKNLAERVVGLISIIAPQIAKSGVVERIIELEDKFGSQDWRVAMQIALEIAQQKFVQFKDDLTAIETGIRVGFAYVTVGVVSAPLEGFTGIELKKTRSGQTYFALRFAGPIRNAGGTAAAVCVIIADYVRKQLGYAKYDPDDKEVARIFTELTDYHEKVTNLQYFPSEEESNFLVRNLPVEIDGDPSEKYEVSNQKDLTRIKTNRIRSGVCLIHSSCIPLKAKKLWKNLGKWITDMNMQDWQFMAEFLEIQTKATSRTADTGTSEKPKTNEEKYIVPNYTYITDLVGGRPVISHPLRQGGLRLRYGRSRTSGFSAQSIHPATMYVLDDFIAIGTQLKVERPGKAAAFTTCDSIEGPIVELQSGEVIKINTIEEAKLHTKNIKKILYLGDVLINYGDFFDRAHTLLPPGYCEEWWICELEKAVCEIHKLTIQTKAALPREQTNYLEIAQKISEDVALITQTSLEKKEQLNTLFIQLFKNPLQTKIKPQLAVLLSQTYKIPLHPEFTLFYKFINSEETKYFLNEWAQATKELGQNKNAQNSHTIEKTIFPYSERLKLVFRNLGLPHKQAATEFMIVDKQWSYILEQTLGSQSINEEKLSTIKNLLEYANELKIKIRDKAGVFIGSRMGRPEKAKMRKMAGQPWSVLPSQDEYVDEAGNKRTKVITEHNLKAQYREKYQIHVNKDGTIRYDGSEVPITHFKPKEVGATVEKLQKLGYTTDIYGVPLTHDNQVLELFPQDVVLPCCHVSPNEPANEILFRTANFVDDVLSDLYGLEPFYNLEEKTDLIGHLVFGLAPHTSAASVGRIVGFTKSQGLFCHPMFHAAMRRDCDGDETCVFLLLDGFLNFSTKFLPKHRGGTMDAPLVLTSIINPTEVDDMVFNLDIAWNYPLEFYESCLAFKKPWDVKIPLFGKTLGTEKQFEGMGFTHDTSDFNEGVLCSAYKTLPSMKEKVDGSMALAEKIQAVDECDMAQIVIEKHFIRDIKGNLRNYTLQEFRCGKCGEKFRRPPLRGKCTKCGNPKLLFTINQASVTKYLEMSLELAKKYQIDPYVIESIEILNLMCESVFGKEREKQLGLSDFFS
jgi:DNA polymerase II large subunit